MKKSALAALIASIILIVLGLVMVFYGVYIDSPHTYYYHDDGIIRYYSYRATFSFGAGDSYSDIGHLFFNTGLFLMILFAILQHSGKDKGLEDKAKKAEAEDFRRAKEAAVDAEAKETVDPGTGPETREP